VVLLASIELKHAQQLKSYLVAHELLLPGYKHEKTGNSISFPVLKKFKTSLPVSFSERDLAQIPKGRLKDLISEQLTPDELKRLNSAFDTVGTIAIVEIEQDLTQKEHIIAETILKNNKQIKTVLKKAGGHEGELRVQKTVFLAGEDTRETIVKENGVRLRINVEEVYYSVRSATERKRIAEQVKPGERVLVMFSGAAPYPCVLAKNTKADEIVGIELNEKGHELGLANLRLNRVNNVILIQGDVREAIPVLHDQKIRFDRIVMPLPHTGHDFLDEAFMVAEKGTIIHLYDFEREDEFEKAKEKAEAGAKRNGKRIQVLCIVPSGQHSPRVYRLCVDFEVLN
jgi:tRNA (guanine37-N1)-methyltransferase